jgi:uncharacterized membrane protein affecting hemolysin expression
MELPINTIVITILAIFVLVAVGIFFFSEASATNQSFDNVQCTQMCFTAAAQVAAGSSVDSAKQNFCSNDCTNECFITSADKISC